MNINKENKIQDLQKKIAVQQVIDSSQEKTIRNQHNETEMLKFKVESQENQIQSQENKIQNLGNEINNQEDAFQNQENKIKRLEKKYEGKTFSLYSSKYYLLHHSSPSCKWFNRSRLLHSLFNARKYTACSNPSTISINVLNIGRKLKVVVLLLLRP